MKTAYLFPGQASQKVGMGKKIYDDFPKTRDIFSMANKILRFDITDLMFNGPKDELTKTINCQPAVFLTNLVYFEALKDRLPCSLMLGHSVAEYDCLAVSRALTYAQALDLVRIRAEAMSECIPKKEGNCKMAAIFNSDIHAIDDACKSVSLDLEKIVQIAGINSDHQVIISGNHEAVVGAIKELKSKKLIKKSVCLNVEGPFHSDLMKPAEAIMKDALEKTNFESVKIPYIANLTGEVVSEYTSAEKIRELLLKQICGAVLWKQSLNNALKLDVKNFVECGYGNTMYNLIKRDYEELKILKKENYLDI